MALYGREYPREVFVCLKILKSGALDAVINLMMDTRSTGLEFGQAFHLSSSGDLPFEEIRGVYGRVEEILLQFQKLKLCQL
ncbi:hypothetical protein TNCV_1697631 [Trichonephila clavipes]|nr:hypothetical protein TNCV_1697631 [Trichonephila clavipes]